MVPQTYRVRNRLHHVAAYRPTPEVAQDTVRAAIDSTNKTLGRVRQIKKFTILDEPLSIARGELTPTLKVKRTIVKDHYATEIDAMYR